MMRGRESGLWGGDAEGAFARSSTIFFVWVVFVGVFFYASLTLRWYCFVFI